MRIQQLLAGLILLVAATAFFATTATAQMKTPDFSAYPEAEPILSELVETWMERPEAFEAFERVRQAYPQIYAHRRGTNVDLARHLEVLGAEGLMPMLWALIADDPFALGYDLRMWRNWRVGLIEAVGRLRDPRSAPVLMSIVAGPDHHFQTRKTATKALGALLDGEIISELVEVARSVEEHREAVVAGLGSARREVALTYLLEVMAESSEENLQRLAVRAIGDWANQWAWQTEELAAVRDEGIKGRGRIISHLIDAYAEAPSSVQREMIKSLQLAGAGLSATQAQARADRASNAEEQALWLDLVRRMEASRLD